MARPKGQPKLGGRKKGTPNKITASVKAALTEAFEQRGGVSALIKWAATNETAFYQLWCKMLPAEVDVTSNGQTISALAAAAFQAKQIAQPEAEAPHALH